jgi:hypothetical protein
MTAPDPPFHYRVRWDDVPRMGCDIEVAIDGRARSAIAAFLGAEGLPRMNVRVKIRPWLDGVEISGRIGADVTRLCGVTLEPFDEIIDEPIFVRLQPAGSPNAPAISSGEIDVDPDAEDPPDVVEGVAFDLGELAVEHLDLAMSPFPRRPGAEFQAPTPSNSASAFAALARLQPSKPKG